VEQDFTAISILKGGFVIGVFPQVKSLGNVMTILVISFTPSMVLAQSEAISQCLNSFGDHPFTSNPDYREIRSGVKVFGIGGSTVDDKATQEPELIYVKPPVNVMGGTTISLLNPNGWYCMRSNVNVMGGLTIKLACDSKFVIIGEGSTVMSRSDTNEKGTTVMGSTRIERDCS
jgi:hypothetical protein